jgi:hypothetical protein
MSKLKQKNGHIIGRVSFFATFEVKISLKNSRTQKIHNTAMSFSGFFFGFFFSDTKNVESITLRNIVSKMVLSHTTCILKIISQFCRLFAFFI